MHSSCKAVSCRRSCYKVVAVKKRYEERARWKKEDNSIEPLEILSVHLFFLRVSGRRKGRQMWRMKHLSQAMTREMKRVILVRGGHKDITSRKEEPRGSWLLGARTLLVTRSYYQIRQEEPRSSGHPSSNDLQPSEKNDTKEELSQISTTWEDLKSRAWMRTRCSEEQDPSPLKLSCCRS